MSQLLGNFYARHRTITLRRKYHDGYFLNFSRKTAIVTAQFFASGFTSVFLMGLLCIFVIAGCRGRGHDHAAHQVVDGEVTVVDAYARAAIPGSNNSALYMTILNGLDEDVVLVSVQTDAAASAEMHETTSDDNGVTRMISFPDGFEVPAGESLVLEPGGKHVMLVDLQADFASGSAVEVALRFANAETQTVSVLVQDRDAIAALMNELDELNVSEIHEVDEELGDGNIEAKFIEQVEAFGAQFNEIDWQAVAGSAEIMDAVGEIETAWPLLLAGLQADDVAAAKPHAKILHDVTHDLVEKVTSMQKLEGETDHHH